MNRRNSGKWIVRSLERHWGEEVVKKEYERIAEERKGEPHPYRSPVKPSGEIG